MVLPDDFSGENGLYVMTANMDVLAPAAPVITSTSPEKGAFVLALGNDGLTRGDNGRAPLPSVAGAPTCEPGADAPTRAELRQASEVRSTRDAIIATGAVEKMTFELEDVPLFRESLGWDDTAVEDVPRNMIEKGPFYASEAERIVHDGVAAYRALDPETRRPDVLREIDAPPRGLPPEDLLTCTVYIRAFDRDAHGELRIRADLSQRNAGPQRDFLWLTRAEWIALVPPVRKPGQQLNVPAPIAERIFRFYLNNGSAGLRHVWDPRDVREGELSITLDAVTDTGLALSLDGFARLSNRKKEHKASRRARFRLHGQLHYDTTRQAFDRFDLLALGDEYDDRAVALGDLNKHYFDPSGRTTLGIGFALCSPTSLGYGTPPAPIRFGHRNELQDYFGSTEIEAGVLAYFELRE